MSEKRNEFNELYSEVRPLLLKEVKKIIDALGGNPDENIVALTTAVGTSYDYFNDYIMDDEDEYEIEEDDIEELESDNSANEYKKVKAFPYYNILEFITLTGLYAMKGKGFDCSKLEESFGYANCLGGLIAYFNKRTKKVDIDNAFKELQGIEREIDFEQYAEEDLYIDDIKHVQGLFKRVEVESANVDTYIELGEIARKILKLETVDETLDDRLSYIMESSFALKEYLGIWTGDLNNPVVSLDRHGTTIPQGKHGKKDYIHGKLNDQVYVLEPYEIFRKDVYTAFFSKLGLHLEEDVNVCYSRCFDFNKISEAFVDAYTSGNIGRGDTVNIEPIYFPYKMLEIIEKYAYRSRLNKSMTGSVDELVYRTDDALKADKICNLKTYVAYVKSEMEREINYYLGVMFVKFIRGYKIEWFDTSAFKANNDYVVPSIEFLATDYGSVSTTPEASQLCSFMQSAIRYCVDCMTTCITLYKETIDIEETAHAKLYSFIDFYFKFCFSRNEPISTGTNEMIIKSILGVGKQFGAVNDNINTRKDITGRFVYYDLVHIVNQEYSNGIPLFAYHAIDTLRNRSENKTDYPVSWDNILLGKSTSDKLLFSKYNSKEIALQRNTLHIIHAGSRSGKGVMCYNIFATAVASQVPIFYIDRKPDSVMPLLDIGNRMFAVNGGDVGILKGDFKSKGNGSAIISRSNNPISAPPYLSLSEDEMYDFVYLRAFLLVRQMMSVREKGKNLAFTQFYNNLIGEKSPLVMVLDEITNYLEKQVVDVKIREKAMITDKIKESIVGKDAEIQKIKDTIAKEEAKEKGYNQNTVDVANRKLASVSPLDPEGVYWRAVYNGARSIYSEIRGKVNAASSLSNNLHTFVIGQDTTALRNGIDRTSLPLPEDRPHASMLYTKSEGDLNPILRTFQNTKGVDFLIGYRGERPWYLGQNYMTKPKDLLSQEKRYFAYRSGSFTAESLSYLEDPNGDVNYVNSWTYIKPFLILNNSDMPDRLPENGENPDAYINIMQDKSSFVGQCIGQCYKAGISPEELIGQNSEESADNVINKAVGFEDYIKKVVEGSSDVASSWEGIVNSLNKSGDLMDEFVKDYYGYTGGWRSFIHDLNPEYIITFEGELADGTNADVRKRLSSTYFMEGIQQYDVVSLFGGREKLGSIAAYYGDAASDAVPDEDLLLGGQEEFSNPDVAELNVSDGDFDDIDFEDSFSESDISDEVTVDEDDAFDTMGYDEDMSEPSSFTTMDTPMGLNFDAPPVNPQSIKASQEQMNIQTVTDTAYEILCAEVIKNVTAYVRKNYGDTVADNEYMINIIHNYAHAETTAYLQEGGQ